MEERLALIVSSVEELKDKLNSIIQGGQSLENVFFGNVKENKGISGLLVKGKAGKEFIRIAVIEKELSQLCELWVLGIEIEWKLLYSKQVPNRISLPSYPFIRERHWLSESIRHQPFNDSNIHPLIDAMNMKSSLKQGLTFQKTFSEEDPVVKDHKVNGKPVLPGVGYLEMSYSLLKEIKESNKIKLTNMVWLTPLGIEHKKKVNILVKEEDNRLQYEICSQEEEDIVTHFRGEAYEDILSKQESEEILPIEDIRSRCSRYLDKQTIYSTFDSVGISYGEYFQGLEGIWGNDQEALGTLKLTPNYEQELKDYSLHPTLADGALQTLIVLIGKQNNAMLPFAVEEVEMLGRVSGQAYSYVKLTGTNKFDVWILDGEGRVCVKIRNIAFRELSSPLVDCYIPGWKE
ncbi:polyketide synthase dehydratase domain-containing protein, partial [Bacillus wiedmannii]|uniref:polyketide synthase dehydratase domain-containing protein n=1 Tax=Bacillus wiedmannii TaxID=1890302 RepID=UPI001155EAE9